MRGVAIALVILAGPAAAQSASDLIDRAIAAHGGRSALASLPDLELRGTSESLTGRSAGRRSDVVWRERADGAYRRESTLEVRGRKVTPVEFFDGSARKRRFGQAWDDLPVDEPREVAAHRLPFLLGAAAADPKLEGETTFADVACWQLSVADGRDRAKLYLAKDDGRAVGIEYPGTSADGMGTRKDVRRTVTWRDHRKVGGLLWPFDVETSEDGTPVSRLRFETITVLGAFDPGWLRVPDPTRRFIPPEELAF